MKLFLATALVTIFSGIFCGGPTRSSDSSLSPLPPSSSGSIETTTISDVPTTPPCTDTIPSGQCFVAGQTLCNGQWTLSINDKNQPIISSTDGTSTLLFYNQYNCDNVQICIPDSGIFVIRACGKTPTYLDIGAGSYVALNGDGNLDVILSSGKVLRTLTPSFWTQRLCENVLPSGQCLAQESQLTSCNNLWTLGYTEDHKIALTSSDETIFIYGNAMGCSQSSICMQDTGRVVIYGCGEVVYIFEGVGDGSYLRVADNGDIELVRGDGIVGQTLTKSSWGELNLE